MTYLEAHGYFASSLDSIFYSIKHNLVPKVKVVKKPNLQEKDSAADVVYNSNNELLLEKTLNNQNSSADSVRNILDTDGKLFNVNVSYIKEFVNSIPNFETFSAMKEHMLDRVQKYVSLDGRFIVRSKI